MPSSTAVDVAIGLAFVYFILSLVCSIANETLANALGWRSEFLRKGLANLLVNTSIPDAKARTDQVESDLAKLFDSPLIAPMIRHDAGLRKAKKRHPSYLPARTFVAACPGLFDHTYFLTGFRTGLRTGELIGLQWDDLDLHGGRTARIERAVSDDGSRVDTPKSGFGRTIDLTPQLCEALKHWKVELQKRALASGEPFVSWVFPYQTGQGSRRPGYSGYVIPETMRGRFDRILKIGTPDAYLREAYFGRKLPSLSSAELARWVEVSDGLPFAALAELIISVCCLGNDLDKSAALLKELDAHNPSSQEEETGPGEDSEPLPIGSLAGKDEVPF